jgi:predicted secreted Zn-dependent protease
MKLTWQKSSRSAANGHCVEIAASPGVVLVRDSKDTTGPVLTFDPSGWRGFLAGVRVGEFDRPV